MPSTASTQETGLRRELGLRDLVLAQVLCVVGSSWVGVAAKLGRAHVVFWLVAMLLFYLPLAAVVIYLNRLMPLEGGLYQWAKEGFGDMAGFLIAVELQFSEMLRRHAIAALLSGAIPGSSLSPPGAQQGRSSGADAAPIAGRILEAHLKGRL